MYIDTTIEINVDSIAHISFRSLIIRKLVLYFILQLNFGSCRIYNGCILSFGWVYARVCISLRFFSD